MMNIQSAINQMRAARKVGKLSLEVQNRVLRRLGYAPALALQASVKAQEMTARSEWSATLNALSGIRQTIETDIAPVLEASRKAEMLFECPAKLRKSLMETCLEQADTVSATVTKPELIGEEYTPEWWKAAEKRERDARKAGKIVD